MRKESLFEELFLLHQVSDLRSGDPSRTGGVIKTGGRQCGASRTGTQREPLEGSEKESI
jgi:hypothetical protein